MWPYVFIDLLMESSEVVLTIPTAGRSYVIAFPVAGLDRHISAPDDLCVGPPPTTVATTPTPVPVATVAPLPTPLSPPPPLPPGPTPWVVDDEAGYLQALLLTRMGVDPVRAIFVECNTDVGAEPWLALHISGYEVIPPTPPFTGVPMTYVIDGGEPVTTTWLPHPDRGHEDFQLLYRAKAVGIAITDALLDGTGLIEVSAGDLEYSFETHGFPQVARQLIESCQPS